MCRYAYLQEMLIRSFYEINIPFELWTILFCATKIKLVQHMHYEFKYNYYFCMFNEKSVYFSLKNRPKPVGHGYVFSMAVGTIGEWLKLVHF